MLSDQVDQPLHAAPEPIEFPDGERVTFAHMRKRVIEPRVARAGAADLVGEDALEVRNALARAVFFYRLGEVRDRSFEQQRYRASGLNLVTAAIVLWNTVYLERATVALRGNGDPPDEALLPFLSPLGWEHINLTGDYLWRQSPRVGAGKFRPLRPFAGA